MVARSFTRPVRIFAVAAICMFLCATVAPRARAVDRWTTVIGVVSDNAGHPVGGHTVSLGLVSPQGAVTLVDEVLTALDGTFQFAPFYYGDYSANGYCLQISTIWDHGSESQRITFASGTASVGFTLNNYSTLTIRFIGPDGQPIRSGIPFIVTTAGPGPGTFGWPENYGIGGQAERYTDGAGCVKVFVRGGVVVNPAGALPDGSGVNQTTFCRYDFVGGYRNVVEERDTPVINIVPLGKVRITAVDSITRAIIPQPGYQPTSWTGVRYWNVDYSGSADYYVSTVAGESPDIRVFGSCSPAEGTLGYAPVNVSVTPVAWGQVNKTVELVHCLPGSVSGTVNTSTGPLSDARVELIVQQSNNEGTPVKVAETTTGPDGGYSFTNVVPTHDEPVLEYRIKVTKSGYSLPPWGGRTTTVDAGQAVTVPPVTMAVDTNSPVWTTGSLTATQTQPNTADLTWPKAEDPQGVTNYRVLINGTQVYEGNTLSATVTDLLPGTTYELSVEATDGQYWSVPLTYTLTTAPEAPTGLTVTPAADGTGLSLSWTGSDAPALSGYRVGRQAAGSGGSDLIWFDTTDSTYKDITATRGTTYEYVVRAVARGGVESLSSAAVQGTLPLYNPSLPVPTGITAVSYDGQAGLTWAKANDPQVSGYAVYRADTVTGDYGNRAFTAQSDNPNIGIGSMTVGKTYWFKVASVDWSGGESMPSGAVSVDIVDQTGPTWPSGAALSLQNGPGVPASQITLSWPGASDGVGVTNYRVSVDGQQKPLQAPDVRTYNATSLASGTTHTFSVEACDGQGNWSAPLIASLATAPAAVTDVTATSRGDGASVTLRWAKCQGDAISGYQIYRRASGQGSFMSIKTLTLADVTYDTDPNYIVFSNTGLNNGAAYDYYVSGLAGALHSSGSAIVTVIVTNSTPSQPPQPPQAPSPAPANGISGSVTAGSETQLTNSSGSLSLSVPDGVAGSSGGQVGFTVAPVENITALLDDTTPPEGFTAIRLGFEFAAQLSSGGATTQLTTFSEPVTFTVTLTPAELALITDPEKVGLYRVNADGSLTFIGGTLVGNRLTVVMHGFSTYVVGQSDVSFPDIAGHWAQKDIELMASRWVVTGTGNGRFEPDSRVTRAQFMAMLVRAMGLVKGDGEVSFSDVSASDWFYSELTAAIDAGLVTGYADGTFRPDDAVTREQVAAMLARALKATGKLTGEAGSLLCLSCYGDSSSISAWAIGEVAAAVNSGIVRGSDGTLAPQADASRAEAATMIARFWRK